MRDIYVWNKVQDYPMSLLSLDIDGRSFISKINEVYYLGDETEQNNLRNDIEKIIDGQAFYFFGESARNFEFDIQIGKISISQCVGGCYCNVWQQMFCDPNTGICYPMGLAGVCSDACPNSVACAAGTWYDPTVCYAAGYIYYRDEYPIPLVFNGTDELVETLSYNVVELQ